MIDAKQFTELYKLVYKDMYRFALCMMKNSHDAEDAVSESVLLAYENVHKLRKEEAFRSWIFQILANVCKKKLKAKERTEVPIEEEHASEDFTDQITEDVRKAFLYSRKKSSLLWHFPFLPDITVQKSEKCIN